VGAANIVKLGGVCVLGTLGAVLGGPAGAGVAAAAGGVAGQLLTGVADGVLKDIVSSVGPASLNNHDLQKLAARAARATIRSYAKTLPRLSSHRRRIKAIAAEAERAFSTVAGSPWAISLDPDRTAEALLGGGPALPDEQWSLVAADFADHAGVDLTPEEKAALAAALRDGYFYTVRQLLKHDAGRGGRAFAALQLDAFRLILARLAEEGARADQRHKQLLTAVEHNARHYVDGLQDDVRTDHAAVITAIGELSRKLDQLAAGQAELQEGQGQTHEKLDDLSAAMATLQAQIDTLKQPGVDPTQVEFPPEVLEAARILQERGDKEQRALADTIARRHAEANELLDELLADPLAETFRLLTRKGDNWYAAGEYDKAVEPYEQALMLRPEEVPARNNTTIAHAQARLGDLTAHRQRAIDIAEGTLDRLPQGSPEWAATQNNLGNAWRNLPTGDRTANLRRAIEAYEAALTVFTREAAPAAWATTQTNLGNAWAGLPTGDRAANLRHAIDAYEEALTVFTREAAPVDWAATQNNLGSAWRILPTGDRAASLQRAIDAFEAALTVRTREAAPAKWATTQNNLGNAWRNLPTGDRSENLRRAIEAYEAALSVYTRGTAPAEWATTQNNLGIAWQNLPTGDRAASLQRAIDAFEAALTVRTRKAAPAEWATTQYNLGIAWAELAEVPGEDRCARLRQAIVCSKAASQVFTAEAFPHHHANTTKNLAINRRAYEAAGCATGKDGIPFDDIPPAE
jgi:tetratricopeptide (TPR) repeat protein